MADDRDSDAGTHTSMPYQAIIVLCLVGAGAFVLCCWALFRHFSDDAPSPPAGDGVGDDGYTQAQHMRLVRLRNQDELQQRYAHLAPPDPPPPVTQPSLFSST